MKRPEQHLIDSAKQRLLREVLEPLGWVVRSVVEHDYGIDFDVEVFKRKSVTEPYESTGVTFKAQLKSSASSAYSANGDFVSEPMPVTNLRYLTEQLNTPTVIMHGDVSTWRLYWHAPQLDRVLERALTERPADRGTITVRVPTRNVLPATTDQLFSALAQAATVLGARTFRSVSDVQFFSTVVCAASTTFVVLPQLRMLPVCDLVVRTYLAF